MTRFLKQKLISLIIIVAVLALLLLLVFRGDGIIYQALFQLKKSREAMAGIRAAILAHGAAGPLFFILIQVLQVILAPIPGEASGFLGGYLFGAWPSFLYSTIGLTAGSWIAFAIGRLLSDVIRTRLYKTRIYHRFNHLVCRGDFVVPFILFLLPGFPKDSLSYLLGLSSMPLPVFLFIAAVGRIPGTLMLSFQGADVYQGNYLRLGLLLLLSAVVAIPSILYRHAILAWLSRYSRRTRNRRHNPDPEDHPDA